MIKVQRGFTLSAIAAMVVEARYANLWKRFAALLVDMAMLVIPNATALPASRV
jgi:hypothetical protein